jgi:hypothetical protein
VVTTRPAGKELWSAADGTVWLDPARVFIVGEAAHRPGATVISADPALTGRYERRGNVVAVPPAVVQSFAAGYITAQLERDRPTNVSSR